MAELAPDTAIQPADAFELDETDRKIIAVLQERGRASWATVASLTGLSASTAARRASALFAHRVLKVAVIPALNLSARNANLYEVRIRCQSGTQRSVAHVMAARSDTRWVAIVSNPHEVCLEVVASNGPDAAQLLVEDIQATTGVLAVETDLVLKTLKVSHSWQQSRHAPEPLLDEPHVCNDDHLTGVDRAIIASLHEDGRRTCASIANELSLDETTVRRRLDAVLRRGCARVITIVQPASVGYQQEAVLRITVVPESLDGAASVLAQQPGVHYLAIVFARNSLVCELIMRRVEDLHAFLTDVVGRVPGVTGIEAGVELLVFKRAFTVCPWIV